MNELIGLAGLVVALFGCGFVVAHWGFVNLWLMTKTAIHRSLELFARGNQPTSATPAAIADHITEADVPTHEQAIQSGEDRAERQWLLEHGQRLPDRLNPCTDRRSHNYSPQDHRCIYCGEDMR